MFSAEIEAAPKPFNKKPPVKNSLTGIAAIMHNLGLREKIDLPAGFSYTHAPIQIVIVEEKVFIHGADLFKNLATQH